MAELAAAIVAAIIGGFLAGGTGYLLDRKREEEKANLIKRLLVAGITDDLQHSLTLYEKIAEEWDKSRTIWFSTLNELKESRRTYQNNKDWVTLLEDQELRSTIFRYYLRSADVINSLEYQQSRLYELERRYNELLRDIKLKSPELSHEQASALATSYVQQEDLEYRNLTGVRIPETVAKLSEYKGAAKDLLRALSKVVPK